MQDCIVPKINISDIPGVNIGEEREYRYIQGNYIKDFEEELFSYLFDVVDDPQIQYGASLSANCKITTPDGDIFYGLSYRGDIEGWRKDFESGAKKLSLLFAIIEDKYLIDSLGRKYLLSDCQVEFYTIKRKRIRSNKNKT